MLQRMRGGMMLQGYKEGCYKDVRRDDVSRL